MNFRLKGLQMICMALISIGCTFSSADTTLNRYPVEQCYSAKYGELKLEDVGLNDTQVNSYLFDCAVSVTIAGSSLTSGKSKSDVQKNTAKKIRKVALADSLLSKGIDIHFKNEEGDNLLMAVITSFLPEKWKERTVKVLIDKGLDLKAKNNNGDTAMDIAVFKGNEKIVKLLLEK